MKMKIKSLMILAPLALATAACTTIPDGPSVLVLPGTGKTLAMFQADDVACRQYATDHIEKGPNQMALESGAKSAALGAILGSIAGAVIDGGSGALIGAGTGLALGGVAGASSGTGTGYAVQNRYNNAYVQCMYAKGNQIPSAGFTQARPEQAYPPPNTKTPPPAKYITTD